MAVEESPAVIVARFLRSNNYPETLNAFLAEASLAPDAGSSTAKGVLTLEQILQEKRVFDVTRSFEKIGIDGGPHGWSKPAPSTPTTIDTLPSSSNILHVSIDKIARESGDIEKTLVVSGADKALSFLKPAPPFTVVPTTIAASDSPLLSCTSLDGRYLVSSSMSGRIYLYDMKRARTVDERRDHLKYVIQTISKVDETGAGAWVATAAWDAKVLVYRLQDYGQDDCKLGDPVAQARLPSNPESILFISHPEISTPVLLVSRRDSTFIYYYALPEDLSYDSDGTVEDMVFLGRQNLAPHSNAWIAFTPSAMAVSPTDPLLLAVATSAVPHMKLIIFRLMLPPPNLSGAPAITVTGGLTQSSQARAELALQDREAAAILIHCTTLSPQTPYSTPALAWRPDGTGVFVNGDDGVVRGLETTTGKIVSILKDGHEPGSKIRCLWAGYSDEECKREVVVSGGFDRRLTIWN